MSEMGGFETLKEKNRLETLEAEYQALRSDYENTPGITEISAGLSMRLHSEAYITSGDWQEYYNENRGLFSHDEKDEKAKELIFKKIALCKAKEQEVSATLETERLARNAETKKRLDTEYEKKRAEALAQSAAKYAAQQAEIEKKYPL